MPWRVRRAWRPQCGRSWCGSLKKGSDKRTVEAVIDERGEIQPLERIGAGVRRRAIVLILDDPDGPREECAVLSERSLDDWNRPEEDSAWSHPQPVK